MSCDLINDATIPLALCKYNANVVRKMREVDKPALIGYYFLALDIRNNRTLTVKVPSDGEFSSSSFAKQRTS